MGDQRQQSSTFSECEARGCRFIEALFHESLKGADAERSNAQILRAANSDQFCQPAKVLWRHGGQSKQGACV